MLSLKETSGAGIIINYLKYYTVVNVVSYSFHFSLLFLQNLRISICEMSEMMPFSLTSFRFDLSEAAKCVDMQMLLTLIAYLSRTLTKYRMATTFGPT